MSIIFSIEVICELKYKPFIFAVIYITNKNSTYLKYVYLSFDVNLRIIKNSQKNIRCYSSKNKKYKL